MYRPRSLPIPGFDSENVFLLREPAEANRIAELANGKKVVVIGTSFIGELGLGTGAGGGTEARARAGTMARARAGACVVEEYVVFLPGMEVAAYLSDKVSSISCIDMTTVPFERVLGEPIGKMLQSVCSSQISIRFYQLSLLQMHEENGVKFYLGGGVKGLVSENGRVTGVTVPSGETLEADLVVAGVGELPKSLASFSISPEQEWCLPQTT